MKTYEVVIQVEAQNEPTAKVQAALNIMNWYANEYYHKADCIVTVRDLDAQAAEQ